MAILAQKGEDYQAIGFLVEHRDDYGYDNDHQAPASVIPTHALSIDELEEKTGLDFFCNVPDEVEDAIENAYEEQVWDWNIPEANSISQKNK